LDVAAIDAAVRAKLADLMSPDHWAELHAALEAQVTAQDEALAKQVTGTDQRAALEAEVARLEAEVARLVNAIASGAASADITTGINARRAQIEEIRAKLNARPFTVDWDSLRKNVEHFYAIMRVEIKKSKAYRAFVRDLAKTMPFDYTPGPFDLGPVDVVLLRQALRKVGVSRIIPSHDADGGGPFEAKQT
jgi:hypothetical protein